MGHFKYKRPRSRRRSAFWDIFRDQRLIDRIADERTEFELSHIEDWGWEDDWDWETDGSGVSGGTAGTSEASTKARATRPHSYYARKKRQARERTGARNRPGVTEEVFITRYLVGWRDWELILSRKGPVLTSLLRSVHWPFREPIEARCSRHQGNVPFPTCGCGIWAYKIQEDLPPIRFLTRAWGPVALWGTVIEMERGWRATHAYPLELFVGAEWASNIQALADNYGVKVTVKR